MLKRVLLTAFVAAACATTANAATISLIPNSNRSYIPPRSAFPIPGGGYAFPAPHAFFGFDVSVLNDAGAVPGYVSGTGLYGYATVDLIARTADGESVVDTETVSAPTITLKDLNFRQNTVYYARLNASPAHGIAQAIASNTFSAPAYLKNYPSAFHSSYRRTVTFDGFFSKMRDAPSLSARNSVRVLIQRKTGKTYKTIATLRPNANGNYRKVIRYQRYPVAYRMRVVAVGTGRGRYRTVDAYKYCVAATKAKATVLCRSVKLGVR